jgi:hypothetical protein
MPDQITLKRVLSLREALESLGANVIVQQQRLDADYLDDTREFQQFWQWARSAGYGELAQQFLPAAQVVEKAQVSCKFFTQKTTTSEFAVRFFNHAFSQQYQYSRSAQLQIQMTVARTPQPPPTKS